MKTFKQQLKENLLGEAGKKDGPEYKKFFAGALKKFGVKSQDELSGAKKKEFFQYVDDNWKSDAEEMEEGSSPEDEIFNKGEREEAKSGKNKKYKK